MLKFLMNLGLVHGMTFRCDIEDGVGPVITPNPNVTRMQPQAGAHNFIFVSGDKNPFGSLNNDRRFWAVPSKRRNTGDWKPKRIYVLDKFIKG